VGVDADGKPTATLRVRPWSKTFLIHGPRDSWEGNIAYNDGHVNFETSYTPENVRYRPRGSAPGTSPKADKPDNIFFDEKDAADGKNVYLGIWRRAGSKPEAFGGIWD
jgi:prepilin-type processing-associated H-X9-DG protein